MLYKQNSLNLISNLLAFGVTFLINFFLTPILITELGTDVYSFYPLVNNFIMYGNLFVVALNSMAGRYVTIHVANGEISAVEKYLASIFWGNIVLVIIMVIPFTILIMNIETFLNVPSGYENEIKWLFFLTFLSFIFQIFSAFYSLSTFSNNRLDLNASKSIIGNLLKIILILVLFYYLKISLVLIGFINLVSSLFILIASIYFFVKIFRDFDISFKKIEKSIIWKLLSEGSWNALNHLNNIMLLGLNIFIVNLYFGSSESGIYALALTIPNFITSLLFIIIGVFLPTLFKNFALNQKESLIFNLNLTNKILVFFVSIPFIIMIFYGEVFYNLWVPSENTEKLYTLTILIIASNYITSNVNSLFNLNTVMNKLKFPTIIYMVHGIIYLACVILFLELTDIGVYILPVINIFIIISRDLIFTPFYASTILKVKNKEFYKLYARSFIFILLTALIFSLINMYVYINTWYGFIAISFLISIQNSVVFYFAVLNKNDRKIFKNFKRKIKK